MGLTEQFPYTNYQNLNLDWIIKKVREYVDKFDTLELDVDEFKKWVENYLDELAVPEAVKDVLDQWAEDGTLQELLLTYKNTALSSNDIDMENLYTYVIEDGRGTGTVNYVIFQAMAMTPGGNFLYIANDESNNSDQCKLREYNANGSFVREALVEAGHANGMTFANNKIYITWMSDTNGSTDKVTVIDYETFTEDSFIRTGVNHRAIAYDPDLDHFILFGGNTLTVMANNLTSVIKTMTVDVPTYSPDQAGQDILYYNGMVGIVCAYPNFIYFIDLEDGHLVKMYNPPQRAANTGAPTNEPESGFYQDGAFYLCCFARLDSNTSANVLCKMDPWRNTLNGYSKYNRSTGNKFIYVDGSVTGPVMTGEKERPFKHIMQAVNAIESDMGVTSPVIIRCMPGTSVGSLIVHKLTDTIITLWDETTGRYTLEGLRVNASSGLVINHANIKYDANASTGTANAWIQYSNVLMDDINFVQDNNTDLALYVEYKSRVKLGSFTIPSTFSRGIVLNDMSEVWAKDPDNTAAARVKCYDNSEFHSALRSIPGDSRYYWNKFGNTIRPWAVAYTGVINDINTDVTIGNASQEGLSDLQSGVTEIMIEFQFTSNFKKRVIFPVTPDNATGRFQGEVFGLFGANKWEGVCYGTYDLANKTITITNQLSFNHSSGVAYARSEGTAPSGTGWCGITGIWVR